MVGMTIDPTPGNDPGSGPWTVSVARRPAKSGPVGGTSWGLFAMLEATEGGIGRVRPREMELGESGRAIHAGAIFDTGRSLGG
jgi:hypothetical protein